MEEMLKQIMNKLEELDKRFDSVDQRFDSIDKRFEEVGKRFDGVHDKIEWAVAELKDRNRSTMTTFGLYTPEEETEILKHELSLVHTQVQAIERILRNR